MEEAQVLCNECDQALCQICDEKIHRGGTRKTHIRPTVCSSCKSEAVIHCKDCSVQLCGTCEFSHTLHSIKAVSSSHKLGVFWDLSSVRLNRPEDITFLIKEIEDSLGKIEIFKSYGDTWGKWKDFLSNYGVSSVHKSEIKSYESLLLDVSHCPTWGLSQILVISGQASNFLPHLNQIKSSFPSVSVYTSLTILPIQVKEVLEQGKNEKKLLHLEVVLNYLKEQAFKGLVIIEYKELAQVISLRLNLDLDEVSQVVDQAEQARVVFISYKEFDKVKSKFVSLKVDTCGLEVLTWTLRSLSVDEMLPSEKAVMARMREVFDLKPSPNEWQGLMARARGHSHSSSAPEFSLFSWSPSLPKFIFDKMYEQASGTHTTLIYPAGEKWHALDHDSKSGDYLGLKDTAEWKEFIRFLEEYFKAKPRSRSKETEQKSIPGGRYGCAQFLKLLGPGCLRKLSLGRLSYMVQLAINDTYLRYDRTLILWTSNSQLSLPKEEVYKKTQALKAAVISILGKSVEGVSLAQLPMHLKKSVKFSYNINDLGFAKLKDLLNTIPQVQIELRNVNHPFAVLKKEPVTTESIKSHILAVLSEVGSIEISKLESKIQEKFGLVDWNSVGVGGFCEFVQVYAAGKAHFFPYQGSYYVRKAQDYPFVYDSARGDSCDLSYDRGHSPLSSHRYSTSIESYEPWCPRPLESSQSREDDEENFSEFYDKGSSDFSFFSTEAKPAKASRAGVSKNQSLDFRSSLPFQGHQGSWFDPYLPKPPGFE